jgi:acyl-CoA dehydrogenase
MSMSTCGVSTLTIAISVRPRFLSPWSSTHAAWTLDQGDKKRGRTEIAMVKVLTPQVLIDIGYRALHIHGSLGTSNEMPLMSLWTMAPVMGIADGPTEVHKVTVARQVLKEYKPSEGLFPSMHLPPRQEAARKKFADLIEHEVANL